MNRRTTLALLLVLASTPAMLLAAPEVDTAARVAAVEWLQQVDKMNYAGSWESAASVFNAAVSIQAWEKAAQSVRSPLGALRKRTETSATSANSLPGLPEGKYVVMQYDTAFENKPATVETLTLIQDRDESWRVAGYFIK